MKAESGIQTPGIVIVSIIIDLFSRFLKVETRRYDLEEQGETEMDTRRLKVPGMNRQDGNDVTK